MNCLQFSIQYLLGGGLPPHHPLNFSGSIFCWYIEFGRMTLSHSIIFLKKAYKNSLSLNLPFPEYDGFQKLTDR